MTLPNGSGKTTTIAVLTNENNFEEAQNAGADIVGNDDLISLISQGNINFDLLIATPEIMPKLAKLGRVLGPKGLMPSPKSGTVTTTLTNTLSEFKKENSNIKLIKLELCT
jgi:Ribosomal protein L1